MTVDEIIEAARGALDEPAIRGAHGEIMDGLRGWETRARVASAKQLQYIAEAGRSDLAAERDTRNTKAMPQPLLDISDAEAGS